MNLCTPRADNYSEEEDDSFSSEQEASDDAVQGQVTRVEGPGLALPVGAMAWAALDLGACPCRTWMRMTSTWANLNRRGGQQ